MVQARDLALKGAVLQRSDLAAESAAEHLLGGDAKIRGKLNDWLGMIVHGGEV